MCLGRVSPFFGRTGRTFNFLPRFSLEVAVPHASPGQGVGEGLVLGAAPEVPGGCRQCRGVSTLQAAALVFPTWAGFLGNCGLLFREGERQRGPAAGCFSLPGQVVPPSPSVGVLHSAKDAWGSPACPTRAKEDAFQLSHFVCSLNDAVNPQSRKTNPLLSSSWPC